MMLAIVPFYVHMLILYQQRSIHRWAIMKAMFAYALVPFALLPISILSLYGRLPACPGPKPPDAALPRRGLVWLRVWFFCGEHHTVSTREYFAMGPINRDNYLMWDDIGRNTLYQDVVSPLSFKPIQLQRNSGLPTSWSITPIIFRCR